MQGAELKLRSSLYHCPVDGAWSTQKASSCRIWKASILYDKFILVVVLQPISSTIFQSVLLISYKGFFILLFTSSLQNLNILDLSHNHLKSANLGLQQQLKNLRELVLYSNQITELNKEDLKFLSNTSLNSLDLSSNPLKEVGSISVEIQPV